MINPFTKYEKYVSFFKRLFVIYLSTVCAVSYLIGMDKIYATEIQVGYMEKMLLSYHVETACKVKIFEESYRNAMYEKLKYMIEVFNGEVEVKILR